MTKTACRLALLLSLVSFAGVGSALAGDADTPLNEDLLNEFTGVGAHIRQAGSGNTATIVQESGAGNFAFSATDGDDNSVTIIQSGSDHTAGVITASEGATVRVDQGGSGHSAGVVAEGTGANISVTQRGVGESVIVRQTGPGEAIAITQGF